MKPRYTLEVWPHGWIFCGPDNQPSIPANALSECMELFPRKAVMVASIVHHLRHSGRPGATVCVATIDGAKKWEAEIHATIANLPAEERWFKGTDVGASSAAIFAVLTNTPLKFLAEDFSRGSTPLDADDFGRCFRLLKLFPAWKERLPEVANAYPKTLWPDIIARWDELCAADDKLRTTILHEIHHAKNRSQ